jgi:hypothetical protein
MRTAFASPTGAVPMIRHLTASLAAAACLYAIPAVAQQARQDFVLVNRTGYELREVYVSPTKSNEWEEDVLGQDTLEDGKRVTIRFKRATRTCRWDLKVVYSADDSNAVWRNINLCEVERVTIRYNRNTDTTTASFD